MYIKPIKIQTITPNSCDYKKDTPFLYLEFTLADEWILNINNETVLCSNETYENSWRIKNCKKLETATLHIKHINESRDEEYINIHSRETNFNKWIGVGDYRIGELVYFKYDEFDDIGICVTLFLNETTFNHVLSQVKNNNKLEGIYLNISHVEILDNGDSNHLDRSDWQYVGWRVNDRNEGKINIMSCHFEFDNMQGNTSNEISLLSKETIKGNVESNDVLNKILVELNHINNNINITHKISKKLMIITTIIFITLLINLLN